MSEHYSHLLIPDDPDFVPSSPQAASFLEGLSGIGSAPLEANIRIGRHTGKVRTGKNVITGEALIIPIREFFALQSLDAIANALEGLDDYILSLSGNGPSEHPPFKLFLPSDRTWQSETRTVHFYEVNLHLRESSVALNEAAGREPCSSRGGEGTFRNPWNNNVIKVPNAACARFWIEFMFGAWLVPGIDRSLDLLRPEILSMATESFRIKFAQGCHFV